MRIEIITRARIPDLYARMRKSAEDTVSCCDIEFSKEDDNGGGPRVAETYNRLASKSSAEMLIFAHDDILFVNPGWDAILCEAVLAYPEYGVLGVVGTRKYGGGLLFSSGAEHAIGKYVSIVKDKKCVRVASWPKQMVEPCMAVDGMFMAIPRDKFIGFDEKIEGLFFYDADYCLRSKCGVLDILIAHDKPWKYHDEVYKSVIPTNTEYFMAKHGFSSVEESKDQICPLVTLDGYLAGQR